MKKINSEATAILSRLLDMLGDNRSITLTIEGGPAIALEKDEEIILSKEGAANAYVLYEFKGPGRERERMIELYFLVFDARGDEKKDTSHLDAYPYYYFHKKLGLDQESIEIRAGIVRRVRNNLQDVHAAVASDWLLQLMRNGYIKQ